MAKSNRNVEPQPFSPAWETFVANAIGRSPSKRTPEEKKAIERAWSNLDMPSNERLITAQASPRKVTWNR
jgi:hypothetical protein